MIKMIVMDLDGTLLREDKTISAATREALEVCRKKGVKIVCATGRGGSAERRAPKELFDGRILMNGATGYIGEELVYNRLVDIDLARELLMACDRHGLKTTAELSGMHYSNFHVTEEWKDIKNYQLTDFRAHRIDAEKLYAIVRNDSDVAFIKERIPEGLYLTVSRDNLAQIMNAEATKMKAIAALAARWGIGAEEIVAFGDDLNDMDMLSGCGIGVAMGNALDEVKVIADEVCETNDNDGIALWLKRHG